MKRLLVFILAIILMVSAFGIAGCSVVREGVTGERQAADADGTDDDDFLSVPAAHNIIGDWFGVYNGSEYLSFRFTADGKCELQPAAYRSDMFGPRYYGEYRWGGDNGDEIFLDLYKGESREVDYGDGNIWDDWFDAGRDSATTALLLSFQVFGGQMRSVAMKAGMAGIDTDGYTVVQAAAFVVLLTDGSSGHDSKFVFGSTPLDENEGKNLTPRPPDSFTIRTERYYTTAELNVRCGPSTDFGTYGTVDLGTPADKIAYMATGHDEWAFVLLMDGGGWMHTDYLSESKPAPETSSNDE